MPLKALLALATVAALHTERFAWQGPVCLADSAFTLQIEAFDFDESAPLPQCSQDAGA